MRIGAQMFTVRNYTDTLPELRDTLARIADIGYEYVQISGTCDYEAEWLADTLASVGLKCPLTHFKFERIVDDTEAVINEHRIFGADAIGLGYPHDREAFFAKTPAAAKKIADAGMRFMYHHHNFEYEEERDGKLIMHYLSDSPEFAPIGFTLDVYWCEQSGFSAVDELRRLSGRVPYIHYKDLILMPDGEKRFAPVGDGILDFDKITAAAESAGTIVAFVEQDNCYGEDPFECLKKSYEYLRAMGLR